MNEYEEIARNGSGQYYPATRKELDILVREERISLDNIDVRRISDMKGGYIMMTHDEAIEKLINTCNEMKDVIEQLQEENAFLADTIEKYNLGQIKSERRFLLMENQRCKLESQLAIEEANRIKKEYESKMSEANNRLADARKKHSEIDF